MPAEDQRLSQLTEICLALPETTREYNGQHATFRVRSKTFAYYLDDHHGDGVVGLACKAPPGANEAPRSRVARASSRRGATSAAP